MRLGIIIEQFSLVEKAKDPGLLAESLASLGNEVTVYCLKTDVPAPENFRLQKISRHQRDSVAFWSQEKAETLLIYSWLSLRYGRLIRALKKNQKKIILKLDSDGRLFAPFRPSYLRVFGLTASWQSKLKHIARLGQWAFFSRLISRKRLGQIEQADAVIIESPLARDNLVASLAYCQRSDLALKIACLPNPVKVSALEQPVSRENRIISVGRWRDRRKNGAGLIRTLSALQTDWQILLIGSGSAQLKTLIKKNNPELKIESRENIPHEELASLYRRSRVFFAPSLADSFNLSAAEALANGCSIAATPLESFQYFTLGGRFGTIAKSPEAEDLLQAIKAEISRWENKTYDPEAIAGFWRAELNPGRISQEIIELSK